MKEVSNISITVVLTIVLVGVLIFFRLEIIGNLFRFFDMYVKRRMISTRKNIFFFGYGDEGRFRKCEEYQIVETPHEIKVSESQIDVNSAKRRKSRKKKEKYPEAEGRSFFSFQSPLSSFLREGEQTVYYHLLSPKKRQSQNSKKKLVIHFPAAGQVGWRDRYRTLGQYVYSQGISYAVIYSPLYQYRQSSTQKKCAHTYQSVADSPCTFLAFVEEARALVRHLSGGFDKIILTGMSMGAFTISKVIAHSLVDDEDLGNVGIGAVMWMPFYSMMLPEFFRGLVNSNLTRIEKPEFITRIIDSKRETSTKGKGKMDLFDDVNSIVEFFEEKHFVNCSTPSISKVWAIHSKYDMIINSSQRKKVDLYLRELCGNNGIELEIMNWTSSHSGSFVWEYMLGKYRKLVCSALDEI